MNEITELLQGLGLGPAERKSYAEIFDTCTGMNPHNADTRILQDKAAYLGLQGECHNRATLLDFIFSHAVMPALKTTEVIFIFDFPVCQAALSRIRPDEPDVAERFECFISGLEIANGFHELCDASEQLSRFKDELKVRRKAGKPELPMDTQLIAALEQGLPDCAGVALGIDRLLMVLLGKQHIDEVLSFPHRPVN